MWSKISNIFNRNSEFAIVLMVLVVLAMVIIPLPHELLDVLISINLTLSVAILMIVIYMSSPLSLTSFPTILLVLALFRIGITISTTRAILLEADAGEIVRTFGEFVAGGNIVVGIIVFIIITVINFIVITKGSERVAEVSARFSLDAMPGKQMSIDSDLRANNITMEQAAERRKVLEMESKLYGSMDGSMKFVKGDSIASIIDIIVNLVGGIIVGSMYHEMGLSVALSTYTILTIGDGMVQQVPALIVAISAGMMITRVNDSEDPDKKNLGQLIVFQVTKFPKAFVSTSIILFIIAFVPGMPTFLFLIVAAILAGTGTTMMMVQKKSDAAGGGAGKDGAKGKVNEPKVLGGSKDDPNEELPIMDKWKLYPLLLHVSSSLRGTPYVNSIKESLTLVQKNLIMELGVEVPQIYIRFDDNLEAFSYQILINEIPSSKGKFFEKKVLLLDTPENAEIYGIDRYEPNDTLIGLRPMGIWVDESYTSLLKESGLPFLTLSDYMTNHLSFILRRYLTEFLGMQEVKNMLDKLSEYQDLIKELLRMIPLNKITEVLQRLIAEDISIRNFKAILDALLEWCQKEKDIVIVTEYVRIALGRYIAHKFSGGHNVIPCILISHELEDTIRDSIRHTATGSYLAIDPDISEQIIIKIKELLDEKGRLNIKPILLSTMDIRRYLRSLTEKELPFLPVLSFQELEGRVEFDNLGIIEI